LHSPHDVLIDLVDLVTSLDSLSPTFSSLVMQVPVHPRQVQVPS